jgi:hypothetical protein
MAEPSDHDARSLSFRRRVPARRSRVPPRTSIRGMCLPPGARLRCLACVLLHVLRLCLATCPPLVSCYMSSAARGVPCQPRELSLVRSCPSCTLCRSSFFSLVASLASSRLLLFVPLASIRSPEHAGIPHTTNLRDRTALCEETRFEPRGGKVRPINRREPQRNKMAVYINGGGTPRSSSSSCLLVL